MTESCRRVLIEAHTAFIKEKYRLWGWELVEAKASLNFSASNWGRIRMGKVLTYIRFVVIWSDGACIHPGWWGS